MKQERKLKLPDFQKRTLETLRTGFYLRVLSPGLVQASDLWTLEERPQPQLALHAVNACAHHQLDPDLARQLLKTPELAAGWKRIFRRKLAAQKRK
jgi:MOSC domain-containing protein YiiM